MNNLPRGYFEFKSGEQTIKGRFCTWTLKRFCDRMKIPNVTELLEAITIGISIHAIEVLLLCAVEYSYVKEEKEFSFKEIDACDWIDDMGGLGAVTDLIGKSIAVEEIEATGKPSKKKK